MDLSHRRRRPLGGPISPEAMATWTPEQQAAWKRNQALTQPLADAGLPVRIVNTLEKRGIFLVQDLLRQSRETLLEISNFGDKTLSELTEAIQGMGLETPVTWKKPRKPRKKGKR